MFKNYYCSSSFLICIIITKTGPVKGFSNNKMRILHYANMNNEVNRVSMWLQLFMQGNVFILVYTILFLLISYILNTLYHSTKLSCFTRIISNKVTSIE